jgi:hypothetical protein
MLAAILCLAAQAFIALVLSTIAGVPCTGLLDSHESQGLQKCGRVLQELLILDIFPWQPSRSHLASNVVPGIERLEDAIGRGKGIGVFLSRTKLGS